MHAAQTPRRTSTGNFSRETKGDIKRQHLGCAWQREGHNSEDKPKTSNNLDLEMCSTVNFMILMKFTSSANEYISSRLGVNKIIGCTVNRILAPCPMGWQSVKHDITFLIKE